MSSAQENDKLGGAEPRTPRAVIDDALRKTKLWDWLGWWLCLGMALLSASVTIAGVVRDSAWLGATAVVPGLIFGVILRHSLKVRNQNIAIRMLEVVLNNVRTGKEARAAVTEAYGYIFDYKGAKAMWFRRRDRVKEVALAIIQGLEDGSIVPDPPLSKDEGVALPMTAAETEPLTVIRTVSLGSGQNYSFIRVPESITPVPPHARVKRAALQDGREVVAAGVSGEASPRYALV